MASFKVGEAPWETGGSRSTSTSFKVGQAPWEVDQKKEVQDSFPGEGYVRGAIQTLPAVGSIAGGLIGSGLGPIGTISGAGLGAAGGKALENWAEGLLGDEKTREKIYSEPIKEGLLDVGMAGAGAALSKGAGLVGKVVKDPIKDMIKRMTPAESFRAPEIRAAADALDVSPTRGMLTEDRLIGDIESALSQKLTEPGKRVASQYEDVFSKLGSSAQDIVSPYRSGMTSLQLGDASKKAIAAGVDEKLAPAREIYESLAPDAALMNIGEKTTGRVARNIRNIPEAKFASLPESSLLQSVASDVEKIKSIGELRTLKSAVGKMSADMTKSAGERYAAGQLLEKLNAMEKSGIMRSSIEAAGHAGAGKSVAKGIIKDIKNANKIYREVSKDVKSLASDMGLGKIKNQADFVREIESMPSEKLAERLFNIKNYRGAKELQKQFPEVFENARISKVQGITKKAVNDDGSINLKRLTKEMDNINPEMAELLFGKDSLDKIKNIKTILSSMPQKVGPSGTPGGQEILQRTKWLKILNPKEWLSEADDYISELALKNPEWLSKLGGKIRKKEFSDDLLRGTGLETSKGLLKTRGVPRVLGVDLNE